MENIDGFKRDLAILEDWKTEMSEEEYQEAKKQIFKDYGISSK